MSESGPALGSVAVTGATGALGGLIVEELLLQLPGESVVAIARSAEKAKPLVDRGITVRLADYGDADGWGATLAGVERLVLVSSSDPGGRVVQHGRVIDAAVAAGVTQLVYTSAPKADDTPLVLADEHAATERLIVASGLGYTILRNNWYHENYIGQLDQAGATGVLLGSTHGGTVASAARADFAAAAVAVLLSDRHLGATYELGGDVAWDYDYLAAALAEVSGRPVSYTDVTTAEHVAALTTAGLDAGTAEFVAGIDSAIAAGALSQVTGDLRELIGRAPISLVDGLRAGYRS